jgi:Flp pilus assembly pilin Flp
VWQWLQDDRGAGLIEWGLLVVLIAIAALIAVRFVGEGTSGLYDEIGNNIRNELGTVP